jgi:CubicO group peptidase (beta-lactamase class C family)
MKRLGRSVAIVSVLFYTTGAWCAEPAKLPDTPVGKRAKRLLEVLETGKRDQIKKFVEENFSASTLGEIPLDVHVDANARFAGDTGGLTVTQIISASETSLRLFAQGKKDGTTWRIRLEVERAEPHQITGIGFNRLEAWEKVPPPPVPEGPLSHAQIAAWLKDYVNRLSRADAFSGTVLVAHRDKVFFTSARGLASRAWNQPNRLDTKFNLGSMNKMFTAVAIAQLVENGKVSLDDPIERYLPDYPNREAARTVTVRHLLTHTSGLADYFNDKFMSASRDRFREVEDYFPLFAGEPLQFKPGARFRYSNAGFMVLGAIVQKASGKNYFDYVRERVYNPAGMVNTEAYELDTDVPNLAVGYTTQNPGGKPGRPVVHNNVFMHVIKGGPAGGGYSTVEDLHRFANALRDGKLIRPETLRKWTTPGDKNKSYALGFQVFQESDPKVIGHGGGFPGISTSLQVDLDNGYVVAVLSNVDGGTRPIVEKVKELLARAKR